MFIYIAKIKEGFVFKVLFYGDVPHISPPYTLTKCSSKIEATEFEQREVRSLII